MQTNARVRIPRRGRQSPRRPVHRGRPAHTQCLVQNPELFPRTVRPTERSPGAQDPDAESRSTQTILYGCVTWSPRACHYDTLRRAHHSFLARCIGWRKHNRTDHPISYLDTLVKTGSETIEAILRKRRIGVCSAHGGHEIAEVRDVRGTRGGYGFREVTRNLMNGVSWATSEFSASTPTSGRSQPRTRGNGIRRRNKGRNFS